MNERERTHSEIPPSAPAAGSALLAAADDAINRVLSGDSQAFNQAVRQEGGQ
jgi:hypothetical protein